MTMLNDKKRPELLIPAGSLEVLKVAVLYGADAVYIGGDMYGLRAKAKNFSVEQMKQGVDFAHSYGKKVYVTANITAHNSDLDGVREYFTELKKVSPDALIISDPGVFEIAAQVCPEIEIHISTQSNNVNYGTFLFWHKLGAKRVVTARELSIKEIKEIRENIPDDLEIETFVHGAMCISYFTGRDANLGACTHPCRCKYYVMEEQRPGEYLPVYENERGTYIFNSKDLCMIGHIPDLVDAGIDSYKVEGRMKTALYVANVARIYRQAIDDYFDNPKTYYEKIPYYMSEIEKGTYRQFTTGFFYNKPTHDTQIYDNNTYVKNYIYLGMIQDENERGMYGFTQKNKFSVGDSIEIMKPSGEIIPAVVMRMADGDGGEIESCPHPGMKVYIDAGVKLCEYDILRAANECS